MSSDRTATATANGYSHSRHTSGALVKMRGLHSRGRRGRSWTGRLRLWHRLRPRRSEPECWFLPTPQRWSRQKRIVPTAPNRFGPPLNSFQGIPTPGLRQKRNRGVNGDASATVNGRVCGEWGPRRNRRNPPPATGKTYSCARNRTIRTNRATASMGNARPRLVTLVTDVTGS